MDTGNKGRTGTVMSKEDWEVYQERAKKRWGRDGGVWGWGGLEGNGRGRWQLLCSRLQQAAAHMPS
jgi:hypothetical protein